MEITRFNFNGAELRCINKDGEPWFIAAEVCKFLEVGNPTQALSRLDDDEKDALILNDTMGRPQSNSVINESGLYSLTLTSRKPEAKKFKKWVTSVVLPAIRKTGAYSIQPVEFKLPANMAEALRLAADSIERAEVAETKLLEAAPKVEFFDTVTKSNTVVTMAVAAQTAKLPYGQNTLYKKLREMGVLISAGSRYNLPKQQYIEQGLFTVNEHKFERSNGEVDVNFTTHVTQKGIDWISRKMKEVA